jgi:hypothetical protein
MELRRTIVKFPLYNSLYFAWRNYLADVSVPLLGTGFVETPEISAGRSIVHFILFVLCVYFGFVRRPKA